MLLVSNAAEGAVQAQAPNVIVIGADSTTAKNSVTYQGTEILPDRRNLGSVQIASCFIQNVGANRIYFSVNMLGCNATANFHGYLEAGQQLDCSNHRNQVWGYSTAGTTVAVLQFNRNDPTGQSNNGVIIA